MKENTKGHGAMSLNKKKTGEESIEVDGNRRKALTAYMPFLSVYLISL